MKPSIHKLSVLSTMLACSLILVGACARDAAEDNRTLSVMSCNVGDATLPAPSAEMIGAAVRAAGAPDILLLQEVPGNKELEKLGSMLGYPFHAHKPYRKDARLLIAVLSRYPIEQPRIFTFSSSQDGSGFISGIIKLGTVPILVCSAHLDEVESKRRLADGYVEQGLKTSARQIARELRGQTSRSLSVTELIDWVNAQGHETVIIGGDFNTIPLSRPIRAMSMRFDDALWPSSDYFAGTYFKIKSPLLPRVDYIFHSPDLKVQKADVIRRSPGDHYPVRAVFRYEGDLHGQYPYPD